jgi:hypothetical protein
MGDDWVMVDGSESANHDAKECCQRSVTNFNYLVLVLVVQILLDVNNRPSNQSNTSPLLVSFHFKEALLLQLTRTPRLLETEQIRCR